jgi:hypothetical protein
MTHRQSDWLIVLCGGESPLHGEAASGSRSVLGRHEPHSMEINGPLCNEWSNQS